MERYKFLWNIIKSSKKDELTYFDNGMKHEITKSSELWKSLYFLVGIFLRFYLPFNIGVLILTSLIYREYVLPTIVVTLLVIAFCIVTLPLAFIPKDFRSVLSSN